MAVDARNCIVAALLSIALFIDALIFIIATVTFAERQADVIVLVAAVLSLVPALSSFLGSIYRLLPAVVAWRNPLPPWLKTILTTFCRRTWFLWIIPSSVGPTFAFQKPSCRSAGAVAQTSWREGLPCRLHRVLVALSVIMLVLDFTIYQLLERRRMGQLGPEPESYSSWGSETTLANAEPLQQARQKERWLQRRNSLSSQQAIYPYTLPSLHGRPHTYRPGTASSRTLRSGRSSFGLSDRSSSFTSSSTSTASRRYRIPLRADCPSIPELSKSLEDLLYQPVPAPPPPAWYPALQHAPLSADPTIRGLSGIPCRSAIDSSSKNTKPSVTPSHLPPPPPALPRRASGHCGRSSTSHSNAKLNTSAASLRPSTTHTNTSSTCALRRPPSIRYPNRQRLWSYTPSTASSVAGAGVGLGGGMGPSMYSVSSYGAHGTRGSTYTTL